MMGVVGADGAGKTTLLQMCSAILDPSEGACRVFGMDTARQSDQITARIGYMSQGFTLYDRLTVLENLQLSARLRDVSARDFATRSRMLLEMAGLSEFGDRNASKLSGGMRKKLALCTNLVHEPRLLLLDEPGLGVDPLSRRQLWEMLERFRRRGITIVVATSYMDEAERCDRILLLQTGAVLSIGTPETTRRAAAGRVFELASDDPESALRSVERMPGVYGIQLLPGSVRFQRTPSAPSVQEIPPPGDPPAPLPAAPTLEDVFVMHSDRQQDVAFEDATRLSPTPGSVDAVGVSVAFGAFKAVDRVSLSAKAGSLIALLGPNGAGKSTFIRALCGLVPISEGDAYITGMRVQPGARSIRQRIGYMSQRFSLYPDLTLAENLSFFAAAYGLGARNAAESIGWASATTRLEVQPGDTLVSEMSGATRQRLSLACSIVHRPAVLFLDEPTSGIDPVSRYRFWRLIRGLARTGMVVIVTTHYLNEADYCDRIGLMHQGRMVAMGSLEELRAQTGADSSASTEDIFITAISQAPQ